MTREFGATAWGRAWLRLAEPTTVDSVDTRLPKARALARRGQVEFRETVPGRVDAVVRVRDTQYPVRFGFGLWDAGAQYRVDAFLGEHPAARQSLSGGDAPDDLAAVIASIAPDPGGMDATCPCSERRRPCLHQLGVLYALVQRIDEEPGLALALRGWDRTGSIAASDEADRVPLAALDPAWFYMWRAGEKCGPGG